MDEKNNGNAKRRKVSAVKPRQRDTAKKARKVPKKISESYLHNSGLYYLERFAASVAHFRRTMLRKIDASCRHHVEQDRAKCVEMLDELIEKFIRAGLLDDAVYTRSMVTSARRRGLSARAIEQRLAVKGIAAADTRASLSDIDEREASDDFTAALRFARRRRLGPFAAADKIKDNAEQKALAAFARNGFDFQLARKVLAMSMAEVEEYNF